MPKNGQSESFVQPQKKEANHMIYLFCDPGGARTHDPMIKSHLLYQLSHGVIMSVA